MDKFTLRFADAGDAKALRDIYAYYVENTTISFEITPPTADIFTKRIESVSAYYPYLVCECGGKAVAYAYADRFREREAYLYDVSVSVYIDRNFHGRKIGSALYSALFELLAAMGIYNAYAGVTLPNEKSLGLHRAFGFTDVGVYHKTGYKLGRWLDLLWLEKSLAEHPDNPGLTKSIHELDAALKSEILSRYAGIAN